jgi:TolB-like protein
LAEVAERLGVNLVLVGTVRRLDRRVLVDVQLVQVPNRASLWSGQFDGGLADIPAVEDQISRAIATRLGLMVP